MWLPDFLRGESYHAKCPYCSVDLQIKRKEVELGRYECPECGNENQITEAIRMQYNTKRAKEEQKRLAKQEERERRETERSRILKEEMERRQEEIEQKQKDRQETARQPMVYIKKMAVIIIFLIVLAVIFFGNVHIIGGRNLELPRIVMKESFGFSETFIKIETITSMPWIAAKSRYPLSCAVLQREHLIESDKEMDERIQKEMKEEIDKAQKESQAAEIARQEEERQKREQETKERFVELRVHGLSIDRIAKVLKISRQTLEIWNDELALEIQRRRHNQEEIPHPR